jgi:hypothetical protein
MRMTGKMGPNGSSQAILMSGLTKSIRIGQIKFPSLLHSYNMTQYPPKSIESQHSIT